MKLKFICRKLKTWGKIEAFDVCEVSGKVYFVKDGRKTFLKNEDDIFEIFDEDVKKKLMEADKFGNIGNSDLTYVDANSKDEKEEEEMLEVE